MKRHNSQPKISEIYRSDNEQEGSSGLIGFTISYSDGTIENVVMEFQDDEIDYAIELMKLRRAKALRSHQQGNP
jgi:hypothetical protein